MEMLYNEREKNQSLSKVFFLLSFFLYSAFSLCFFHSNVCDAHTSEFYDSFFSHFFFFGYRIESLSHAYINEYMKIVKCFVVRVLHAHTNTRT